MSSHHSIASVPADSTQAMKLHDSIAKVPEIVGRLYSVVEEPEKIFPGRHFTPDGHLTGSPRRGVGSLPIRNRFSISTGGQA